MINIKTIFNTLVIIKKLDLIRKFSPSNLNNRKSFRSLSSFGSGKSLVAKAWFEKRAVKVKPAKTVMMLAIIEYD